MNQAAVEGARVARWQRLVVIAATVVILVGAGVFAYTRYSYWHEARLARQAALRDAKKTVAEQTAGTEYFLKTIYSESDMTYAQLFDRADDRTKKITDAIVSIQASDLPDSQKEAAANYLNALSQTLDAMEMEYRKSLSSSNTLDAMKAAQSDYLSTPYNEFSDSWERRRLADATDAARKALDEFKDASQSFNSSLKSLKKTTGSTRSKLEGFALLNESVLDRAIAKSDEELRRLR